MSTRECCASKSGPRRSAGHILAALRRRARNQRGLSLLEVIIALAVMGVVTIAIFQLYITQHKNYMTQDDISVIQQNARSSIDEIARNVRMAGHEIPAGLEAIAAANTDPDTITVIYNASGCDTYLSDAMPQPSAELKCATDVSCFSEDQWVYIYEPDSGGGEWFEITEVQIGSRHIQHNTMTLSKCYGKDAIMVGLEMVKFFIDNTTDPDHPNLMVQRPGQTPQVFAEDIIDLQFRYRMKNGMIIDQPTLVDNIREVMIAVTGRSSAPDYESEGQDHYRSRTFSSAVYLRNI
ncbi:MAG: prepilin-type N-terminal cleavage/methylation domain-containing protein [candidate division Zixibacteria bacterium]|nr:prepilin-type N-terminal cleavage/methylation domain-containing protein [candidate division Zixibacteria bacterium]